MRLTKKTILPILIITIVATMPLSTRAVQILDPLGAEDMFELAARFVQAVLGLVGAVALIHFIIAGFGIILSRGNPESLKKHKDNLVWTTIGLVILFSAYAIISFVLKSMSPVG
jgi:flagellar biosynthesis protein FlhB